MKKLVTGMVLALVWACLLAPGAVFAVDQAGQQVAAVATININQATVAELQSLPGIGEVTAANIVAYRTEHGEFASADQLLEVKGIGEKTLKKILPLVSVE